MKLGITNYATEKFHLWRDFLRHPCQLPVEQWQQFWPENPTKYREIVGACSVGVKKLSSKILELIREGLGLESGFFDDEFDQPLSLLANHYPPCPNPSLVLGVSKHSDPNLITILLQDDIHGLQVFKDGKWIGVEPLPNAFVVNFGYTLQIISNGKLKSAEHRVVTNSSHARTSAGFFVSTSKDRTIEPAEALIDASNPPVYNSFKYKEILGHFLSVNGDSEVVLEPFKVQAPFKLANQ
ncbi:hyoscyamine 6-dioxygenase-like [Quillaja saponaria]|uniref:Hyoscyamine 6-dioxygenase-like n=1 Tax=Quillaja saponaria TaxID=32244 RepID=A0AAD7VIQ5_QUISA|nr:hyoscyamine 6-dioxygenase-like [Quillaja saponaria]